MDNCSICGLPYDKWEILGDDVVKCPVCDGVPEGEEVRIGEGKLFVVNPKPIWWSEKDVDLFNGDEWIKFKETLETKGRNQKNDKHCHPATPQHLHFEETEKYLDMFNLPPDMKDRILEKCKSEELKRIKAYAKSEVQKMFDDIQRKLDEEK